MTNHTSGMRAHGPEREHAEVAGTYSCEPGTIIPAVPALSRVIAALLMNEALAANERHDRFANAARSGG
ncbi:MAG TPA: hypothetical protein VMT58_08185 [Candidatus Binataceae bacterium]|nr:hypothetical protein [Candidatus Binataceae bacterium]